MTFIANPIYDVVFKYLMEDEKAARILLSALLKKKIIHLEMRRQEYTVKKQTRISFCRIDFAARVREKNGEESLVLIELQKTWRDTEMLRFRQYLGMQYLNEENMVAEEAESYGLPIVTIYILGHKLGDLTEPVIYVRRRYLDYDDQEIHQTDRFIESLTHDSIIVQIPYLKGRTRNHLERLLSLFDQEFRYKRNSHLLEINEENYSEEEQPLINRLVRAAATPDVSREMQVEDEILSEIEALDTKVMMKEKVIEEKDHIIEEKDQVIEKKDQLIEAKDQLLEEKARLMGAMVRLLNQQGLTPGEIARRLSLPEEEISGML